MAKKKTLQKVATSENKGCVARLRLYAKYTLFVFGACCIFSFIMSIAAPDTDVVPTVWVFPTSTPVPDTAIPATATTSLTPTSSPTQTPDVFNTEALVGTVVAANALAIETTPQPTTVSYNALVFRHKNGISFIPEGIVRFSGSTRSQATFVLLAQMVNDTNQRQCLNASDIRLLLDGVEYDPDSSVMSNVKQHLNPVRDYIGAFAGHCVEGDGQVPTFVAFDVPLTAERVQLRVDDNTQELDIAWLGAIYPEGEALSFEQLNPIATQYVIAQETSVAIGATNNAAASMTAASWTDTPTATITPTPQPTNTSLPSNTPRPTALPSGVTYYATDGNINGRECPERSCEVLQVLGRADEVEVIGIIEGDSVNGDNRWYQAVRNNEVIYVHVSLLSRTPPAAPTAVPIVQPQPSSNTSNVDTSSNVQQPQPSNPTGASARCNDGTYSYSAHRRGTCSHHGGVAEWLQNLPP